MASKEHLYHYTHGQNVTKILDDGFIRPTDANLMPGEKPVAWFTTRNTFEPTAIPFFKERTTGMVKDPSLIEAAELGGGLWRFGILDSHPQLSELHPWLKITRLARTPNKARIALEKTSREMGGNPYTYWGSLSPISILQGCTIETSANGVVWLFSTGRRDPELLNGAAFVCTHILDEVYAVAKNGPRQIKIVYCDFPWGRCAHCEACFAGYESGNADAAKAGK